MTTARFYGGVSEIGGNKIVLEDEGRKLLLDFGMSFRQKGLYFEEYLKPRVANGLTDLVEMGLLPSPSTDDFAGAYRSDWLLKAGLDSNPSRSIDAVLLSHFHYDHSAYIAFLREDIPVYCSEATKAIAEALRQCGKSDFETEVYYFKKWPNRGSRDETYSRDIRPVRPASRFQIDGLEILPLEVDHSIPGAMAFIIYTSNGNLLYTGDLRLQGPQGQMTTQMVETAQGEDIDWIICEGTNIDDPSRARTEDNVRTECTNRLADVAGLAVADFAFKDASRFGTMQEVARANDRKLVISTRDAHFLSALRGLGLPVPDPTSDDMILVKEKKSTGTYEEKDYGVWERPYLDWANVMTPEDIGKMQSKVLFHMGFFSINLLIDLQPVDGSLYIKSTSEAHNEDQQIDEKRLGRWLDHFKLDAFESHASGHANQGDLRDIIESISPRKFIVPVHTEHPEMCEKLWSVVRHPDENGVVALD